MYLWQGKSIVVKTRKTGKQLFDDIRNQLKLTPDTDISIVKEVFTETSISTILLSLIA